MKSFKEGVEDRCEPTWSCVFLLKLAGLAELAGLLYASQNLFV